MGINDESSDAPLSGLVFCCTSVQSTLRVGKSFCSSGGLRVNGTNWSKKNEIVKSVAAMGGAYEKNLTKDVTHLIVGSRDTEKFDYVVKRRRDVNLLRPTAIPELFKRWQAAEEFDMDDELVKAKLGVFEGLKISITNTQSEFEREKLIEKIEKHGGEYSADLTRDVTHLLTASATGKKFEYATKWNIPVLAFDWAFASIKRGAMLSEQYFDILLAPDEIGRGALSASSRTDEYTRNQKSDMEVTKIRKPDPGNVWNMLQDIAKPKPDVKPTREENAWMDQTQEVNIYVPRDVANDTQQQQQPVLDPGATNDEKVKGIFSNHVFEFYGFSQKESVVLESVVSSHHGAIKTPGSSLTTTLFIINSKLEPDQLPQIIPEGALVKTEWLIERSMHKKKLVIDFWGDYIEHRDLGEFSGLNVCISGYSGVELMHLEKLISMLGATCQPIFIAERDLLISTRGSKKFEFARKWNVPIVNELWLWKCARTGTLVPLESNEFVLDSKEAVGRALTRKSRTSRAPSLHQSPEHQRMIDEARAPSISSALIENIKNQENAITNVSISSDDTDKLVPLLDKPVNNSDLGKPSSSKRDRRLIGRAQVSTMVRESGTSGESVSAADSLEIPVGTQVSYLDLETQHDHKRLMEALGTSTSRTVPTEEGMTPAVDLTHRAKRQRRQLNKN